jgi:hypothetical protein
MDSKFDSIVFLRVERLFKRDEFMANGSRGEGQLQYPAGRRNFRRNCAFNYPLACGASLVVASALFGLWVRATFDFHGVLDVIPKL